MSKTVFRLATACAMLAAAAAQNVLAQDITGAGASFPAPLYAQWADAYYKATGLKVNYQSLGSSAGIRQIRGKTVAFGATDAPLSDAQLAKDGLVQFPTVMGGVVPVVNITGIGAGQLKLTGAILGDIYLGKITKWNDASIMALNPGLNLPAATIAAVRRADGSGTSFIFTNYLSKVNADWKSKVGEGAAVNWPTGVGGKGNEGVAGFVQRLPNSIGYVEYSYATSNKMSYVLLKNAAGNFVRPDDASFKAAAAGAAWDQTFYQVLTEQPGKNAWPISGATFILMHRKQQNPKKGAAVLKFVDWAYVNGDKMASELEYVSMPDSVKTLVHKLWSEISDNAGQPLAYP